MKLESLLLLMQEDTKKCIDYCEKCAMVPNVYQEPNVVDNNWDKVDPRLQYDVRYHKIYTDTIGRPDKMIMDDAGQLSKIVRVSRLPVPMQKKIVLTASAILGSPGLDANDDTDDESNMLTAVQDTFELNKLDYRFLDISQMVMSEKCCAELWYTVEAGDTSTEQYQLKSPDRLRMKILARSKGDSLYPVFDEYDNLIAFGRGYWTYNEDAKKVQHFDVYTAEKSYHSQQQPDSSFYWMTPAGVYAADFIGIDNHFGKIPVVYYWQSCTEWHDVQPLIERFENIMSDNADTNMYFANPVLLGIGKVLSLSQKGETGKVLELENGGDAKYLTWDSGPVAQKAEMDELKSIIFNYTSTPDLAFDKLITLGQISAVTLQTLFSDSHFKASYKAILLGEGVQRRINFLKTALAIMDKALAPGLTLQIKPKFNLYVPKDPASDIDLINKAISGGILSTETGVDLNPLVDDSESELTRISGEKKAEADAAAKVAAANKPTLLPVNN